MRGDDYDGPARTVYEALAARPPLGDAEYEALIEQLRPLYLDEIVCPIHLAANQLRASADAAASGEVDAAVAAHHSARDRLYDALWNAGLLTLDEELQELAVDVPTARSPDDARATRVKASDRLLMRQWHAWRTDGPP